jgi:T5SS/PEP-CTERM-associated repeat protein
MKVRILATLALSIALTVTARAALTTNNWISGSGKWEDGGSWDQGAPSSSDAVNLIANITFPAGGGTTTIDAATWAFFPTLTISNLVVANASSHGSVSAHTLALNNLNDAFGTNKRLTVLNALTITSGGAVTITNSVLRVGPPGTLSVDGTLLLNTGSLIATNVGLALITNIVGNAGVGQMTVLGGNWQAADVHVGEQAGSSGTLHIAGGTNILGSVILGYLAGSTGTVWMTGGELVTTNSGSGLRVGGGFGGGFGTMVISNGIWRTGTTYVGPGKLTVAGGSVFVTADFSINSASVLFDGGSINLFAPFLVNDGDLTVSNGSVVSTSYISMALASTAHLAGGTNNIDELDIGSAPGATGTVWMTNGKWDAFIIDIGDRAFGQMTISNGMLFVGNTMRVGGGPGSRGQLLVAGGRCRSVFHSVGSMPGATGSVCVTGGQLDNENTLATVGEFGVGELTVSNGLWSTGTLRVGFQPGAIGTVKLFGGTSTVATVSAILGNFDCTATGTVMVAGGQFFVTNEAYDATLEIRSGALELDAGTFAVDRIVMTNACGQLIHTGGTLVYGSAVLDPNRDDDGDRISNGYEQSHGLDPLNPADANLDSDGDGFTNLQEFQAGTDATNSASFFGITSITRVSTNIVITWMTGPSKTNALERSIAGNISTNFVPIYSVTNTTGTPLSFTDLGAATNFPARFYRVRLVP